MKGTLERIWRKRVRRGPMDEAETARLIEGRGLEGNTDQGGARQVTVLSRDRWEEISRALGEDIDPALRRANLLVSGVELAGTRGRVLRIGPCRLEVRGETRPCELMDDQRTGLRDALDPAWGGGVYTVVLTGGPISIGDEVAWESE